MNNSLDWILNHHKVRDTNKMRRKIEEEEMMFNRMQHNKKTLDDVWAEIIGIIYQIINTKDFYARETLNEKYDELTALYCNSNAIDELIIFR